MPLTDRDRSMLELERQWWKHAGAKESAVREELGMPLGVYAQVLNQLIDRPEALAHDPRLVKRLRRLRDLRRAARSSRRAAGAA